MTQTSWTNEKKKSNKSTPWTNASKRPFKKVISIISWKKTSATLTTPKWNSKNPCARLAKATKVPEEITKVCFSTSWPHRRRYRRTLTRESIGWSRAVMMGICYSGIYLMIWWRRPRHRIRMTALRRLNRWREHIRKYPSLSLNMSCFCRRMRIFSHFSSATSTW